MMLLALSIFALFLGSTFSANVGLKYLYRDSACATLPYQVETTFPGVCIYSRTGPTSSTISPVLYATAFSNGTVLAHAYQPGTYPGAQCTGNFQVGVFQVPFACTLERDIATNATYYSKQQVAPYPGLPSLTNNRPYALVK